MDLKDKYLDRIADALEEQMGVSPKLIGGNVLKPNIYRIADALDPEPTPLQDGTLKNPLARIAEVIESGGFGSGGGGKHVAFIIVKLYLDENETAQVSVTDGSITINQEVTGEDAIFLIPTIGTWTISANKNGESDNKTIVVSEYPSIITVYLFMTADTLSNLMSASSYARLSHHTGDGASFDGRYFTRTTDEPVIFFRNISGGYYGYAVITINNTIAFTNNSNGDLDLVGRKTTANGTVYYVWSMNGMWANSNSPTFTINEENITIPDIAMVRNDNSYITEAMRSEIESYIDMLSTLYTN